MSAAKHTPGPWKIVAGNAHRKFNRLSIRPVNPAVKGMAMPLASAGSRYIVDGIDHAEANARLIAAAPCLLESLQALVALQDSVDPEGLFRGIEGVKARAAIAKATGGAA